jgi:hypothetical protein
MGWEHTNTHDVELESALQQLALDLGGDAVETDMAVGEDGGRVGRGGACGSHWDRMREEHGGSRAARERERGYTARYEEAPFLFGAATQGAASPLRASVSPGPDAAGGMPRQYCS